MPSWNFSVIVYANQLCTKIDLAKLSFTVYGSKDRTGVYGAWNFSTECLIFCQVWISQTFECTCVCLCKYIDGSFLAAFAYSVLGNVSVSALSLSWPVSQIQSCYKAIPMTFWWCCHQHASQQGLAWWAVLGSCQTLHFVPRWKSSTLVSSDQRSF